MMIRLAAWKAERISDWIVDDVVAIFLGVFDYYYLKIYMVVFADVGSCFAFSPDGESKTWTGNAMMGQWAHGFFIQLLLFINPVRLFFPHFDFRWGQNRSMRHRKFTNPLTSTTLQNSTGQDSFFPNPMQAIKK